MSGTLFVGDVHGCADQLGRMLGWVRPRRVVLLGDLFTRGPDPRGVWCLIQRWKAESVLGNHDEDVLRTWKPGRRLPREAFRWLAAQPLTLEGQGWIAVHAGIHPKRGVRGTRRRHALHMRRYRDRPWAEQYRGKKLVLHGHDAASGLVDRRPYTLGLDTGCARTGKLTAYLLEDDTVVQVS